MHGQNHIKFAIYACAYVCVCVCVYVYVCTHMYERKHTSSYVCSITDWAVCMIPWIITSLLITFC